MHASGSIFGCAPKPWYAHWRPVLIGLGLLLPTLALAGYVAAGNQLLRDSASPNFVKLSLEESHLTDQKRAEISHIARIGSAAYLALVLLPFIRTRGGAWPAQSASTVAVVESFERPNRTDIARGYRA